MAGDFALPVRAVERRLELRAAPASPNMDSDITSLGLNILEPAWHQQSPPYSICRLLWAVLELAKLVMANQACPMDWTLLGQQEIP